MIYNFCLEAVWISLKRFAYPMFPEKIGTGRQAQHDQTRAGHPELVEGLRGYKQISESFPNSF